MRPVPRDALLALIGLLLAPDMMHSSPDTPVASTSLPPAGDWVYRGEGAANLVVAYRGADPRWRGTVLRIRKGAVSPDTRSCEESARRPGGCDRSREFLLREVVPRIGAEFVLLGAVASVDRAFLEAIHAACLPLRPPFRVTTPNP
jgi:inositol-pentakisphosphate 2-kinase